MDETCNVLITDSRIKFSKLSFSNYAKPCLSKNLLMEINKGDMNRSYFWTAEMICSGMFLELWNTIFLVMSKYIHIHNPRLPLYIKSRYGNFRNIMMSHDEPDYELRNNNDIRTMFFTIVTILCKSIKKVPLEDITYKFVIDKDSIDRRTKAPSLQYIKEVYIDGDPREYVIAINELTYNLIETNNKRDIYYWINWIVHYDNTSRKKKKYILCSPRERIDGFVNENPKYFQNIIWIVWECIFYKISRIQHPQKQYILNELVDSLFKLFTTRYTPTYNKKRIHLVYHSIELILGYDNIKINTPLIDNGHLKNIDLNINRIFTELKESEVHETEQSTIPQSNTPQLEIYNTVQQSNKSSADNSGLSSMNDLLMGI